MNSSSIVPPRINRQFRRSVTAPSPFDTSYNGKNKLQMSEFPVDGTSITDGSAVESERMDNFHQKKNCISSPRPPPAQQHLNSQASSSSSTSSSSAQQMVSSSSSTTTTSSRVAKSSSSSQSQRVHLSEMKASSMKSDLSELKSSISEMKNLSALNLKKLNSVEDIVGETGGGGGTVPGGGGNTNEPLITFPDPDTPPPVTNPQIPALSLLPHSTCNAQQNGVSSSSVVGVGSASAAICSAESSSSSSSSEVKFQQKRVKKVMTEEHSRLDLDGVTAENALNMIQEQRSVKSGEVTQQESQNVSAATMRLQTDSFCAEKKAMAAQQQRQTVTSTGIFNQEKHMAQSSQSNFTITTKGVSTKSSHTSSSQMSQLMNGSTTLKSIGEDVSSTSGAETFEDLERLTVDSNSQDVERAILKYSMKLDMMVQSVKRGDGDKKAPHILNNINEMMRKAWAVPAHGHELGYSLCNVLRNCGGMDLLMSNCDVDDRELQFSSARLLEQCLTTENRTHVVENGLEKVVTVACGCTKYANSVDHSRVGTGILEHLFKHSEGTCSDVIRLGGLDAVLFECRKNDVETLRHCAGALANLSLYGGAENQEAMIKRKVPMWLFPLAFHNDDNIKYYACLAIAVLVANTEIEAAVLKSGTLNLVEPFVTSHNPSEFAKSNLAHAHGQSKNWLQRLVPVLSSKREEARNLAAFHFCMEAGIKKQQGNTEIFREIGAIEPLKKVASCPNAVASKYAAQALRLIGEEVPHKLSQQVPLWSSEDVREWVKQIGFAEYANNFVESRVDGDLLLQLAEENLRDDIGIINGIRRRRFTRELQNLKKMSDYSSRDASNLNMFLQSVGPEFSIYTYSMLNAGVDRDSIRDLSEDQLVAECGIKNSIHRIRILEAIRTIESNLASSQEQNLDKSLDVFVSYRRSNGSQLASLLKVHLQLRGFTVFIDVERLEAGKFDNNLLQSIRQAKHFLLVLTPKALERCIADSECKDWVHREIVAALQSQCNIIPIIDNFQWPEPEELPEDMRAVCHFNGVRWIHDYQDACVDKLERFMRGELNARGDGRGGMMSSNASAKGDATPSTPSRRKSSSPMPSAWRPPTSPKGRTRRKRAVPSRTHSEEGLVESPLARSPTPPSRSQSEERLLDTPSGIVSPTLTSRTNSEDALDDPLSPSPPTRTQSLEGLIDLKNTPSEPRPILEKSVSLNDNLDKLSDSVVSDSDTLKRKKNFMDRCVNKVRSLIKK